MSIMEETRTLILGQEDADAVRRYHERLAQEMAKENARQERMNNMELYSADENCSHYVIAAPGGGVKCTKCPGWFCY